MKKHIFGFALFSLIVASFAFIYAFLYAPSCPPKEAVKPPVPLSEPRTEKPYCNYKRNKLSFEVVSSQYFLEENKIVSKIRVSLNEYSPVPSKIFVTTTFSSVGNIGKEGFGDTHIIENPFAEGREKIVTVVSRVSNGEKIKKNENLYVLSSVTDYDGSTSYKRSGDITEAKPVLFVYGKSSYTEQKTIGRTPLQ